MGVRQLTFEEDAIGVSLRSLAARMDEGQNHPIVIQELQEDTAVEALQAVELWMESGGAEGAELRDMHCADGESSTLVAVNGKTVAGTAFEEVMRMVQSGKRPVTLTFTNEHDYSVEFGEPHGTVREPEVEVDQALGSATRRDSKASERCMLGSSIDH